MNILKSIPNILTFSRQIAPPKLQTPLQQTKHAFSIFSYQSPSSVLSNTESIAPRTSWLLNFVRTNIRNNFPRPSERKRIKVHGWVTRLKTKGGRAIIMRRILKGRHVLSH